ncbi:NfeD family protein [Bartonella sp. DGB1]|uniref:NfeD family protein n=1 Tax=Bartonella sp. DGB1 TaxID=3239807 RepID=UPI0035236C4D
MIGFTGIYFWILLGLIFGALELLGAAGYATVVAVSAFVMAGIISLFPNLTATTIFFIFLILVISFVIIFYIWSNNRAARRIKLFNQKDKELIGVRGIVSADSQSGYSRMQLADTSWRIYSKNCLQKGDKVIVIAIDGATLIVKNDNEDSVC